MTINKAMLEEYQEVRAFYHSVIDSYEDAPYDPMWEKDIYPSSEELQDAIEVGSLFIGRINTRIAGAMVINQKFIDSYQKVTWPTELGQDDFMVIHLLGVHREYAGRGFAGELVMFAIRHARERSMKAIRLEVLKGNLPENQLYEAFGFYYVDTVSMFYEDTGLIDLELYELRL